MSEFNCAHVNRSVTRALIPLSSRFLAQKGQHTDTSLLLYAHTQPNSISDHMYRMAMLAMCTSDANLDISKYVPF